MHLFTVHNYTTTTAIKLIVVRCRDEWRWLVRLPGTRTLPCAASADVHGSLETATQASSSPKRENQSGPATQTPEATSPASLANSLSVRGKEIRQLKRLILKFFF